MLTVTKTELKESKKIKKKNEKKNNTFARCQQSFFFETVRVVSRQVTRLQLQMHLSIHIRYRSVSVNIQVSM